MPTVSIYVPQKRFREAEKESAEREISLSRVLLGGGVIMNSDPSAKILERLCVLEAKLDQLICGFGDYPVNDHKKFPSDPETSGDNIKKLEEQISKPEEDMLRKSIKRARDQAGLDKDREALVRKKGESSSDWLIRKKAHAVRGND